MHLWIRIAKDGKPSFLIIKKQSTRWCFTDFQLSFLSLTVYLSLLCTWQVVFSLPHHLQTEYTRQLWNRWLFLPEIVWPLESRLVTGKTMVWIQKQIGKWIRNCLPFLHKCYPGAHEKNNGPETTLMELLNGSSQVWLCAPRAANYYFQYCFLFNYLVYKKRNIHSRVHGHILKCLVFSDH